MIPPTVQAPPNIPVLAVPLHCEDWVSPYSAVGVQFVVCFQCTNVKTDPLVDNLPLWHGMHHTTRGQVVSRQYLRMHLLPTLGWHTTQGQPSKRRCILAALTS